MRPRLKTLLFQDGYVPLPCHLLDIALMNQGSWGGKGTKKQKKNPKFLVQTAGIEPAKRKDFQSSNVIITEKKDRKASQFQVKDLPYPYTSIEQYEARFKNPLGSEWNSRAVHQKETMPRVTKKVRLFPPQGNGGRYTDSIAWSYHRACAKIVLICISVLYCCIVTHCFTPSPCIARISKYTSRDSPPPERVVSKVA